MKKGFIVLVIILAMLVACKNETYKFERSDLQIIRSEISEMPEGKIYFRAFTEGESPLLMNKDFLTTVKLNIKGQKTKLVSVAQEENVSVDVLLFSNLAEKNTLLSDKQKAKDYKRYVNYFTGLKEVDSLDTQLLVKLKEEKKEKETDNFSKNILKFAQKIEQNKNEKLFVIFIDSKNLEDDNKFREYNNKITELIDTNPNWWFGIFSKGSFFKLSKTNDYSIPENCLFIEIIKDKEQQLRFINNSIEKIKESKFIADFSFDGLSDPLKTEYEIELFSDVDGKLKNKLSDNFIMKIDSEKLKKYYLTLISNSTNILISNNQYKSALLKLHTSFESTNYSELREKAYKTIQTWFSQKINKIENNYNKIFFDNGLDFIDYIESIWVLKNLTWYKDFKKQFLIPYSDFQKANKYSYNDRMDIYNEILTLDPENVGALFNLYECEGDSCISVNKVEEGLSWYAKAIKEKSDAQLKEKLAQNLKILIIDYNKDKEYYKLNEISQTYNSFIKNDFEFRYYWANAAQNIHETKQALTQYNWIIQNWKDNSFISWNELLSKMFYVHAEYMDFDEAYDLLKRIAINNTAKESPNLTLALSYLRGKYIKPFIIASSIFFRSENSSIKHLKKEFDKTDFPAYVQAIYTVSTNNQLSHTLYQKNDKISLPKNLTGNTTFISNAGENIFWFIQKISNGYLILQTNDELTESEQVRLTDLQNDYANPSKWYEVEKYIFDNQNQTTVRLLGIMIGIDYCANNESILKRYATELTKAIPNYEYFAVQNKQNKIVYSTDFKTDMAFYHNDGWNSSSKAELLFSQEIDYGSTKIIDIAYPIYYKNNWLGVTRFGFKKY